MATPMSIFTNLRERFRDKAREELCAHLHSLVVAATPAERDRTEEGISRWRGKPLGPIQVADSAVRSVNLKRRLSGGGEGGGQIIYYSVFGVPGRIAGASSGIEQTKRDIAAVLAAFPDLQLASQDLIAEGDKVAAHYS